MGKLIIWVLVGFILALAGIVLLAWLLWVLWKGREKVEAPAIEIKAEPPPPIAKVQIEEAEPAPAVEAEAAERVAAMPVVEAEAPPPPDDLKLIEGIGPKIAEVLQAAGITTFAQLATAEVSWLEQTLEEADPRLRRLADPNTWPEQARLAAAGDWEAFEALLGELKGGRRV